MKANSARMLFALIALAFCALAAWPQSDGTRVDGRITDAGKSLVGVRVVLSHQETFMAYRATTDKYGTFSISDVPRGDYLVSILNAADDVLFRKVLTLTSAPDAPIRLDIDIKGEPPKPPPSSAPAKEPAASAAPSAPGPPSAKDVEFDGLVRRYEAALRAGDHQAEVAALKALVAADPTRWDYFEALGDAQLNLDEYENAAQSFEKGVEAGRQFLSTATTGDRTILQSDRDRTKAGMAQMLLSQGNAYQKLKKYQDAISAYDQAAKLSANPAAAYLSVCVLHYNARLLEGAVDACDKAIAADPAKPDAYFVKGALLFLSAKPDRNGKIVAPPGTAEALKKYLELAPQGPQAKSARQLLEYMGGARPPGAGGSGP